ncbi:hypothetical protein J2W57_000078 [Chryseobacterium ginsenosidimutans]|uniref:Uncharacterized protein n=1 Tax=Chryseobacterium geocarposphaerae TaxID=1416776 RepID=A0ABU1L8Y3_9FLAO|nr:hypothetical protein [Chryseobacterium geocarposphaerae]MDR6696729.1 hypothetical protein [Chryseobacterium ginsenosidimutans]
MYYLEDFYQSVNFECILAYKLLLIRLLILNLVVFIYFISN